MKMFETFKKTFSYKTESYEVLWLVITLKDWKKNTLGEETYSQV